MQNVARWLKSRNYRDIPGYLARTSLIEVLLMSTLVLSKYYANIDFSYPSEVLLPISFFAVLASAVFYFYRALFGRVTMGHLAALPFLYGMYEFSQLSDKWGGIVKGILPRRLETEFTMTVLVILLFGVVCGLVGWGVTKLSDHHFVRAFQVPKIVLFLVAFVFVTQVFRVGVKIAGFWDELHFQYKSTVSTKQDVAKITAKPDVYYLVFDRYASASTLQNVYGYDNSKLLDYLDQQGFVMRDEARANYPFTMSSISSTLAMDYHTQLKQFADDGFQTGFPYRSVFNHPPVADDLKQNGYTYNQVSSWWDFSRVGTSADHNLTQAFRMDIFGLHVYMSDLTRDIINRSVLSPLLKKGITVGNTPVLKYSLALSPQQNFEWQMSALKTVADTAHDKPQFTFAHILSPHDPYIYAADGSTPAYDNGRNDNGVDENIKYTNQLTYLNTRIQDLIGYVRAHDPNAAIIIQADEGPYPKEFRFDLTPSHFYNPKDLAVPQMKQKFGILAAYYMPNIDKSKVKQDITTSVNPFRFVLANYLGYDIPMLPNCQFAAGDKFKVYDYTLMNQTLTGQPADSRCNQY